MEDQGKRLLLAVAIAFGLMLVWMYLFPPEPVEPERPDPADGERVAEERPVDETAAETAPDAEAAGDVEAPAPRPEEELFAFEFDAFRAEFSTYGGSLTSWELKDERWAKNGQLLDLVETGARPETRPFRISFENSTHDIPADAAWERVEFGDADLRPGFEPAVRFRWSSDELRVDKVYSIHPEHYLLALDVQVQKLSGAEARQALTVWLFGYQDPYEDTGGGIGRIERAWQAACLVSGSIERNRWEDLERSPVKRTGVVDWAGFQHSYFLAAAAPQSQVNRLSCEASAVPREPGQMAMAIEYPFINLRAGDPVHSERLTAYLGPKYLSDLDAISGVVGYDTGFERAVDLGFMALLARPLLWLLIWFQGFVVNWGLAIILLTFTVKAATHYWTHKSMKSMRQMTKLRPEMEKIQKKYKEDPQRMRVEMMNLYKARGVNPLSGCLPMLLQMPIWFALYRTLTVAGELYQAPFLWIHDLTTPDPFYILPILLMGMMFLQAKFTPTTGDGMQQKILMYGMPLMFGGFSLFFPAGLTLYIFTSTGLTALHHLWIRKMDPMPAPQGGAEKSPPAKKPSGGDGETSGAAEAASDSADEAAPDAVSDEASGASAKPRKKPAKKRSGKKKKR
jgi:YidC/Oxa1 family membrane protein insertase